MKVHMVQGLLLSLIASSFFSLQAYGNDVWQSGNRKWSDQYGTDPKTGKPLTYEDACSDWISQIDIHVFADGKISPNDPLKSPFQGQADCGRAAAILHATCAFKYHLPVAFYDKNGMLVCSSKSVSSKCANLTFAGDTEETRAKSYFNYLDGNMDTFSVSRSSCPVQINPKYVKPGTIYQTFPEDGSARHTRTLQKIDSIREMEFIFGTDEESKLKLAFTDDLFTDVGIASYPQKREADGFRNWRHFDEYTSCATEPGYSLEQYDENQFPQEEGKFEEAVMSHWPEPNIEIDDVVKTYADNACHKTKFDRKRIVDSTYKLLLTERNNRPGFRFSGTDYDVNSTPKRDADLKNLFDRLDIYLDKLKLKDRDAWEDANKVVTDVYHSCQISYGDTHTNLLEFKEKLAEQCVSSDPNADLASRWGQGYCSGEGGQYSTQ